MEKIRRLVRSLSQSGSNGSSRRWSAPPGEPVSWYDYYTPPGENPSTGLLAEGDQFTLNGREIQILSGAVHYFRVHPQYWRTTLRKLRAAGLNAVETYIVWNLHEPRMDVYDFGQGGNDMSEFLALTEFLKMAKEEDLFVILRPGPYICSEWDFGGLPSYLLRHYNVHVRSFDAYYLERVAKWFDQLIPKLERLQYTNGGPVIALQVENEMGAFGYADFPRDRRYLHHVKDLMIQRGISELLFTSDSPLQSRDMGSLQGVLQTANFQRDASAQLSELRRLQPDRPLMAMEFWTGWYDHWFNSNRSTLSANDFKAILEVILEQNSSLNMYMFMGGTSFGFMAGANWSAEKAPSYMADTTSYDYDAVLTEGGRYTEKYSITKELLAVFSLERNIRPVEPPEQPIVAAFEALQLREAVCLEGLRSQLEAESSSRLLSMEQLAVNEGSGQSHGIVWYRANVNVLKKSQLKIRGHVRDLALVIIDGQLITQKPDSPDVLQSFGYWAARDAVTSLPCSAGKYSLDILVENMGRVNYGEPHVLDSQRKGLYEGHVEIDGKPIQNWEIYPMEMKKDWINNLQGWKQTSGSTSLPTMLRGILTVGQPADTYLDMRQFTKGVVFVNGFNLGRYISAGPIYTLYLPAPLLKSGENQIVVFEEFNTSNATINFSTVAISTAVPCDISEPSMPAVGTQ